VQAGVVNSLGDRAVSAEGFYYAPPIPSSQVVSASAATVLRTPVGALLKYGVTATPRVRVEVSCPMARSPAGGSLAEDGRDLDWWCVHRQRKAPSALPRHHPCGLLPPTADVEGCLADFSAMRPPVRRCPQWYGGGGRSRLGWRSWITSTMSLRFEAPTSATSNDIPARMRRYVTAIELRWAAARK